jgi:predicted nuclease with TOPRIM domain
MIEQSRTAIRLIKKSREEKEAQNNELKDAIKRYECRNKQLDESVNTLKKNISKMNNHS